MLHQSQSPWSEKAWAAFIRAAPLRSYTRLLRVAGEIPLPRTLRGPLWSWIGTRMGMDLSEAEHPIGDYRCFRELFARRLRSGMRPVDLAEDVVVSPVDGCLTASGLVERGKVVQAKGIDFPLEALLADEPLARALEGGATFTLYLRPRDYHRIHCPVRGRPGSLRRLPGTLLPVKPYMVRNCPGLMVENERVVITVETGGPRVVLVCVAATGVGNITTILDGDGAGGQTGPLLEKGDELACFNLGSTVILFLEPGQASVMPVAIGQEVRMGQALARLIRET